MEKFGRISTGAPGVFLGHPIEGARAFTAVISRFCGIVLADEAGRHIKSPVQGGQADAAGITAIIRVDAENRIRQVGIRGDGILRGLAAG